MPTVIALKNLEENGNVYLRKERFHVKDKERAAYLEQAGLVRIIVSRETNPAPRISDEDVTAMGILSEGEAQALAGEAEATEVASSVVEYQPEQENPVPEVSQGEGKRKLRSRRR